MKLTTVKTELPSWFQIGEPGYGNDGKVKVVVIGACQCAIVYLEWDEVRHLMSDKETWHSSQAFRDAVAEGKEQIKAQIHKQLAELDGE